MSPLAYGGTGGGSIIQPTTLIQSYYFIMGWKMNPLQLQQYEQGKCQWTGDGGVTWHPWTGSWQESGATNYNGTWVATSWCKTDGTYLYNISIQPWNCGIALITNGNGYQWTLGIYNSNDFSPFNIGATATGIGGEIGIGTFSNLVWFAAWINPPVDCWRNGTLDILPSSWEIIDAKANYLIGGPNLTTFDYQVGMLPNSPGQGWSKVEPGLANGYNCWWNNYTSTDPVTAALAGVSPNSTGTYNLSFLGYAPTPSSSNVNNPNGQSVIVIDTTDYIDTYLVNRLNYIGFCDFMIAATGGVPVQSASGDFKDCMISFLWSQCNDGTTYENLGMRYNGQIFYQAVGSASTHILNYNTVSSSGGLLWLNPSAIALNSTSRVQPGLIPAQN